MREEGGWCRKLNGRNQTPVARCSRQAWSEVPVSKGSVSVVFSNSSCCIHTLNTLFCLFRHPKPFPDKSNPCMVPRLLSSWRWKKWQSWVNHLPLQPPTALRLWQLLTHEQPGCPGMELHPRTWSDGQPHTQWRGRWLSCEQSKQQWPKVLGDVWSENRVCLCFLIWKGYLADAQGTALSISPVSQTPITLLCQHWAHWKKEIVKWAEIKEGETLFSLQRLLGIIN